MTKLSRVLGWVSALLILSVGFIHVIDAKDSFSDATYKGWLFYANGVVSLIAAYGIYRQNSWAWNLGFIIAIFSLAGYIASRTIGLPLIPAEPDNWFEPLGVAAMATEVLFVIIFYERKMKRQ